MKRSRLVLPALVLLALVALLEGAAFKRGDSNADAKVDISDAVNTLGFLFLGGTAPPCNDAADTNDDGKVDISDAVNLLNFLFTGGGPPPAPHPDCGEDSTADGLDCATYEHCKTCFGQSDLEDQLRQNVTPVVCIEAGQVDPLTVGALVVTVCPPEEAAPCPGTAAEDPLGCPVDFTVVEGSLDVPGRTVTVHIEGKIDDLPVVIEDTLFGNKTTCRMDVAFKGDVVIQFSAEPGEGGELEITEIFEPFLENEEVTITTQNSEFLCKTLVALQEQYIEEVKAQLQTAAASLVQDLRTELVGKVLCRPGG
ncbi:MAG: hypothetical protein HY721_30085 [Planctomycetes bacterium]|nr:hypothetical protein [Planctomycetota bacterium]